MTHDYRLVPLVPETHAIMQRALRDSKVWQPYSWFGYGVLAGPFGGSDEATSSGTYQLAVEGPNGAFVGRVTWARGGRYGGSDEHRGWVIGALILPEYRGTGAAHAAVVLLVDYLFSTTPVNRIESFTSGAKYHRTVRRPAGLRFEGWLRGAQWREGKWHDVAAYGVTRDDWERSKL